MWQGATEALLDAIGPGPGMSCLDVGSGPGSVMRLMADRVGKTGRVTGLEIDGKLGHQALADLKAQGGTDFQLVEANMLEADGSRRPLRSDLLPTVSHAYARSHRRAREIARLD